MSAEATDLLIRAKEAAVLRAHRSDPNVVALAVERTRQIIDYGMWIGIAIGMAFTTANVQNWAAGGAAPWASPWVTAWLLAPLVEIPLLVILFGEQVTARYGVAPGTYPRLRQIRWTLLAFGYVMNTWSAWANVLGGRFGWDEVVRHSIPPIAVLLAVEALTDLREALGEAIYRAVKVAETAQARKAADEARAADAVRAAEQAQAEREAAVAMAQAEAAAAVAVAQAEAAAAVAKAQAEAAAAQAEAAAAARARPRPERRKPKPERPKSPGLGGPLGDGRTGRQIGVEWALEHWSDDLRPIDVGTALMGLGVPCSKGERSRVMTDARKQRLALGLSAGTATEDEIDDTEDDDTEADEAAAGGDTR
jgi:hypothetical protein